MKQRVRKDGNIDYIFDKEEFMADYLVGGLMEMDDKQAIVRVYGPIELKKIVIKKKRKK